MLQLLCGICFGGRSACKEKTFKPMWHRCISVTFLILALVSTALEACKMPDESHAVALKLGNLMGGEVTNGFCDYWKLSQSVLSEDSTCSDSRANSTYLFFEFWQTSSRSSRLVLFMVVRGSQPSATLLDNGAVSFDPRLANEPQLGDIGTLLDSAAIIGRRSYQRVLVPIEANSIKGKDWYVTVANLDDPQLVKYKFRVQCIVPSLEQPVPCPKLAPDQLECGGPERGICGAPPEGVGYPLLNRVCYCQRDWGDYNCQTRAPQLSNGVPVSTILPPGDWSYWQISVPLPTNWAESSGSDPALLVELSRSGGDRFPPYSTVGPYGGDLILFVMPKNAEEGNRVPYFEDFPLFADWSSFRLQQNLHYVLDRRLTEHATLQAALVNSSGSSSGSGGGGGVSGKTVEYYVAVYNQVNPKLLKYNANVTLRARWNSGGKDIEPLCPGDCYNRGMCSDPYDPLEKSAELNGPGKTIPPTKEFMCTCNKGYGGPMCEGTIRNLTLSAWGDGGSGYLEPGQWAFFVFNVDPSRFSVSSDDIDLQWVVRNVNGNASSEPWTYNNALWTMTEMAFPRLPQDPTAAEVFLRGQLVWYNQLFLHDSQWKPIGISGGLLKPGYSYVLGLYNSDYVRHAPYNYTITMSVPTHSRTWMHPYMSVVLGVSASIILCLIMTLCRRMLQRYGWGPFRPRGGMLDGGGPDGRGNSLRVQVAQMPPRQRGVPADIIDGFRSYEYRATRAEKVQLAKSRPEPQPPQPPQPQQQPSQAPQQGQQVAPGNARPASGGGGSGPWAVELVQIGTLAVVEGGGGRGTGMAATAAATTAAAVVTVPTSGNNDTAGDADTVAAAGPSKSSGGGVSGSNGNCGSATSGTASDFEEEPQCAVCLCEYEEGESITQLPCRHEFHEICIRKWLQTHYTCPICRVSMLPEQQQDTDEHEPGSQGNPRQQSQQRLQRLQHQQLVQSPQVQTVQVGGRVAMPVIVLPTAAAAAAAATASPPPPPSDRTRRGFFARVMVSVRRASTPPRQGVSLQPVEMLHPSMLQNPEQQQQWSTTPWATSSSIPARPLQPYESYPPQSEPVPATLAAEASPVDSRASGVTAASGCGAVLIAVPPPPGSPQLLAHGPSATLDSPSYHSRSGRGSDGATNATIAGAAAPAALLPIVSVGSPSLSPSPSRLAAGRQSSSVLSVAGVLPLTPGPDAVEVLPSQLVDEQPSPRLPLPQAQPPSGGQHNWR